MDTHSISSPVPSSSGREVSSNGNGKNIHHQKITTESAIKKLRYVNHYIIHRSKTPSLYLNYEAWNEVRLIELITVKTAYNIFLLHLSVDSIYFYSYHIFIIIIVPHQQRK